MFVNFTNAGREALDSAIPHASAHLVPMLKAVRDHGMAFVIAAQSRRDFAIPETGPAVIIIGDDMTRSLGPPGFHLRIVRRLLGRAKAVAIMAGAPVDAMYSRMTQEAVTRRAIVVLIETTVTHETEWDTYVREANPAAEMYLASPTVAGWQ
ncbi:hypothetical protein MKK69_04580 [Methylobacterium sp. J-026]|uniref:hypothetical protein n=1 Tax=Methylobacterium sp. J-026 TaxID=2836624 RepID=UPI001FBAAE83|nr:hypothetical protein [Methylobacterium sp. J-026]MCJ2133344.1 hypothetical protein [Methylobacterium sp. J-026]